MYLNQTAHAASWANYANNFSDKMEYSKKNKSKYENNGLLFKKLSVKMKFIID